MKISPVAPGAPVAVNPNEGQSAGSDRLARAKAVAAGQPAESAPKSGDAQVDRIQNSVKRLKINTQASPDRHLREEPVAVATDPAPDAAPGNELATNEQADATSEDTKPLSPQFAALAKQRREIQLERQKLDAEKKALSTLPKDTKSLDEYRARVKANALSVLLEEGVTYDQLTEQILAQGNGNADLTAVEARIKALEEGIDKKLSDRETQTVARAEEAYLTRALAESEALAKEGETYSLIRKADAFDEVLKYIYGEYKRTGNAPTTTAAMDHIETQLLEESTEWAKMTKVQSRLTPAQAQQQTQPVQTDRPGTKVMRTLTNRDGVSSTTMNKRERAIAAMEGRLKS